MSQAITWAIGNTILDDYVIERELGRGGMGCVWLVKSRSTGRHFAVKQTLIKDDEHRKAFLTELQTWIDLPEHPNIVPCRFFRTVGDEIVIFADYIAGGSLAEWIARRKLTKLEQILDVAIQFAWGLHAVHERGLIHQDVKPGNVLMTPDGVPLVTDFGLARARLRASEGQFVSPVVNLGPHSVLISAGGMTPAYASPEQVAGQPLSRKTDIWSWGVSVLDMFMGGVSCPHGGHIAAEVLKSFLENGQMEAKLPEMPGVVVGILAQCFVRDPTTRVVKLDLIAKTLVEYLEYRSGQKYALTPMLVGDRVSQGFQHDRRFMGVQRWRDPREWLRDAYVAVGRDPKEADNYQPPPAFSRKGAGVADLAVYEEAERLFLQAIENGSAEARESLALYNEFLALLYGNKAFLYRSLDDATGALRAYDQCIAIRRRLEEQLGRQEQANYLAMALIEKADAIEAMGDLAGAVEIYDESIAIYKRLVEQEGRRELADNLAMALTNKASAISDLGDMAGAIELYDQGITIFKRLVEQEGHRELADMLAMVLMSKADASRNLGDAEEAVDFYDQSIVYYERLVEQEGRRELTGDLAKSLTKKASAISDMGDVAGAVALYDQGIALYKRLVEQDGRRELADDLAKTLMNKASAISTMGDVAGAIALYDQSIALYRRLVEQDGRQELADDLAKTLMNKASAISAVNDLAGAVELYDKSITIYKRLVEQEGRRDLAIDLATVLMRKAGVTAKTGDWNKSILFFDECMALYKHLVELEGRNDLAVDLARVQLLRAGPLVILGNVLPDEIARAQHAYTLLTIEAQRTGRSDLQRFLQWAQTDLAGILS